MKPIISIIIKTLNEEKNIDRCIKSVIKASKGMNIEIIVADSASNDNTIVIAKKYPVKIVQLKNSKERSCGVGNQLGYQYAKGKYILTLDGDMELCENFIEIAIDKLEKDKDLAGVGGDIKEMNLENMEFLKKSKFSHKTQGYVKYLSTGSIYRTDAIRDVGYFSNQNLHAFEELELGLRLYAKKWKLERIKFVVIKHYGHTDKSLTLALKRLKTKYVYGYGELIRSSIGKPYLLTVLWKTKIQLGILISWIIIILLLFYKLLIPAIAIPILILVFMSIKKASIKQGLFSIFSWHIAVIGLIAGFLGNQKNPNTKIEANIIKRGRNES